MAGTGRKSIFYFKVVRVCPVKISYTCNMKTWIDRHYVFIAVTFGRVIIKAAFLVHAM